MAAVGQFNSGVTPVLHSEHHAQKDCEQSHGDNKKRRPSKPERLRRGRQRDKLRVQALREQLAAAYSSPSASSSEERPVNDAHASTNDESLLQQCQMKLSMSVHKLAAQQAAVNAIIGVCFRMSAPRLLVDALIAEVNSAIANLAAASDYVLTYVPQQGDVSVATDSSESGPVAFNIFDAEDSVWTSPILPGATRQCDSGDAAAGASSVKIVSQDFNSQILKPRLQTQCGPSPQDFNSQDLADSSVSEPLEVGSPCSGPGPTLEPKLAPDVDNSRHLGQNILPTQCGLLPQEYDSQNLANSSGSELLEVVTPSSGPCTTLEPRLAPVDVLSRQHGQNFLQTQCGPLPQDFNSQDLAHSSVSEHLEVVNPRSGPCATLEHRLAPDVCHPRHHGQAKTQCGPLPQDFNSQDLADSSFSVLLGVGTPCSGPSTTQKPRLAPDVVNSRHRGQDGQNILQTQCEPLPQDFNSQDLANSSFSEPLEVATPCSEPCATLEPRLAPDVDTSRHLGQVETQSGPLPQDFNSQDLAVSEPFEVAIPCSGPCTTPRLAPDDDNSRHRGHDKAQCGSLPQDFNSQDLAVTPTDSFRGSRTLDLQTGQTSGGQELLTSKLDNISPQDVSEPLEFVTPCSGPCATLEPRLAPDVDNSRHRGQVQAQCGPLPQDFDSQDLAFSGTPCNGLCTTHKPRLAPDVVNSRHRGQDQRSALSLGPSERECQRTAGAPAVGVVQHAPQSAECNSPGPFELPLEFKHTTDSIIRVYTKRKKPLCRHLRDAVHALTRVAEKHGVPTICCRHYVHEQSPTLAYALDVAMLES